MTRGPVLILSGAGLSAESGIGTFRDAGGLWSRVDWREVATPEGFAADPARVLAFYDMRRRTVRAARPNAAHHALARLEAARADVTHVTQNVDDLMEQAGAARVIHMHGAHARALCAACAHRWPAPEVLDTQVPCPACGARAARPDVVWFGETPYHLEAIGAALERAALFVAIGTSGTVYPAAGFVAEARARGARTLELNLEPTQGSGIFDETRHGPASEVVPAWVEEMLAG